MTASKAVSNRTSNVPFRMVLARDRLTWTPSIGNNARR